MAFFHLITHAGFKALLFLCAGFYMFTSRGAQDIRLISVYGGPAAIVLINVSNLALCGIPFMSGFYSKDRIVDYLFVMGFFCLGPIVLFYFSSFICYLAAISYGLVLVFLKLAMLLSAVNEGGWNERAGGRRAGHIFCGLSAVSLWGQTLNLKSFLGLG